MASRKHVLVEEGEKIEANDVRWTFCTECRHVAEVHGIVASNYDPCVCCENNTVPPAVSMH